jgi:hypothetical protein
MNSNNRRLIVSHSFDCTVETVIDAFLREGFTIRPVGAGDLRHHSIPGDALRYAVLEATLPELSFASGRWRADLTPMLCCRIELYELVGKCTMVTAESPVADYPQLALLVPRLTDRLAKAVCAITRSTAETQAA